LTRFRASAWVGTALTAVLACAHNPDLLNVTAMESGTLPAGWYTGGADCAGRPHFLVHAYNPDFHILRQSACTNFEKPFLYLLFGDERALLLDTGAAGVDVAATVNAIIGDWLQRNSRASIELVVAHSHTHSDHVAGDAQFTNRLATTIVGHGVAEVQAFFGIRQWPEENGVFDLGGRVLDVIPIPGHQMASIALYDRRTGILLTGDTFYPGRLYVRDAAAFTSSIRRLVDFVRDRTVTHILGTHIENTSTPFVDYPEGTIDQPDEHSLQLTTAQLIELDAALAAMNGAIARKVLPDFTIWPVP
jgi:glyoxylase-like metal-dependent hydrolase (beta-lactamase superfamily II)